MVGTKKAAVGKWIDCGVVSQFDCGEENPK